jgi:DNA-binding XRE family transcriptional regulator
MLLRPMRSPGRPPIRQGRFGRWLAEHGLNRDDVARRLGVNRRHVDHLAREDRRPSLELAIKIEQLTRGEIPAAYFVGVRPRRASR